MTSLPFCFINAMVSYTSARFSSGVAFSTSVTCRSHDLPKIDTAGVFALSSERTFSSSSTAMFLRRVLPKAHSFAFTRFSSCAFSKNSMSFGFETGLPASIYATPKPSSTFAMASLSDTEKDIPSLCAPSRRVVSSISSCFMCVPTLSGCRHFTAVPRTKKNSFLVYYTVRRSLLVAFKYASRLASIISVERPLPV